MNHKLRLMPILSTLICMLIIGCAGQDSYRNQQLAGAKRDVGEAYMRQGDYTAALRELLDAEKLYSDDHILHNDLGLCYMNKKKMADAIIHFRKAVAIKPSYAPARNNLGTAYLVMKEWDTAIDIFKEITKDALYGTPHYPLSNIGLAYYHKGEYNMALKYYQQALKIQENFVNALRGAGRCYIAKNEGRMALRHLEKAVKSAPKAAQIHYELGEAYLLVGRMPQALVSYETAMELSAPDSDVSQKAKQRIKTLR